MIEVSSSSSGKSSDGYHNPLAFRALKIASAFSSVWFFLMSLPCCATHPRVDSTDSACMRSTFSLTVSHDLPLSSQRLKHSTFCAEKKSWTLKRPLLLTNESHSFLLVMPWFQTVFIEPKPGYNMFDFLQTFFKVRNLRVQSQHF